MANFVVMASNCGCCAIKHIRNFTQSPKSPFDTEGEGHDEDQDTADPVTLSQMDWAYPLDEKPDNAGDAFRAVVAQIKRRRPSGIITCNLVETTEVDDSYCCEECNGPREDFERSVDGYDDSQIRAWQPIMDELGFNKVVAVNSNSDNKIHHYTLVYDE